MNTDRDNFHDWARSKEDTSFAVLSRDDVRESNHPAVRWGRIAVFAALGVALVAGFKLFAGL